MSTVARLTIVVGMMMRMVVTLVAVGLESVKRWKNAGKYDGFVGFHFS